MTVKLTRSDVSVKELRKEARRTRDGKQAQRLLAVALVMEGASRQEAATAVGLSRQSLRDWIHRYNAEGIEGLCDRKRSGRPPRLDAAKQQALVEWVEEGPDIARHGVVRWRRVDLAREIKRRLGITLSARQVGRLLRQQGLTRLSVRPQHPEADPAAQEAFKKTSPIF